MPSVVLEKLVTQVTDRIQVEPRTIRTEEVCTTEPRQETTWRETEDGYFITTETVTEQVCYQVEVVDGPEFEYVTTTSLNKGWNAGARSVERVEGDFYFQFKVNPASRTGIGVGRSKLDNDYRSIPHCFYFTGGQFRVSELGSIKYGPAAFSRSDVFTILRVGDEVVYKRNHDVVYRSQRPSSGSMIAIAAMYMGGDRVL